LLPISSISSGEQTSPATPASEAQSREPHHLLRRRPVAKPICRSAPSSRLVSTVTARISVRLPLHRRLRGL